MGLDWVWDGMGLDLCAGLLYEHRFAMLINVGTKARLSSILNNPYQMGFWLDFDWVRSRRLGNCCWMR